MRNRDENITNSVTEADDERPELNGAWFEEADAYQGAKPVRLGRPKSDNPKQPVTLRLDRDLVDWFKRGGDGWQPRINEQLRKVAGI
jgi:uncharacterized protein (DUF4415 family)